jgi:tetratricopeptide (TPR) repeat protein
MSGKFSKRIFDTLLNALEVEFKIQLGVVEIKLPIGNHAKKWWENKKASEELLVAIQSAEEKFVRENPNNKAAQILHDFSLKDEKDFQAVVAQLMYHLDEEKIVDLAALKLSFGFEKYVSKKEIQIALDDYLPYLQRELIGLKSFCEIISAITIQRIDKTTSQTLDITKKVNIKVDELLEKHESEHTKLIAFEPEIISNLEELPEPGQLPLGSRILFYRNAVFTGRIDELKDLARSLFSNNKTTIINQYVATTGMGGIGKTQLAVEFCYRYGRFFHGVHWINAYNADINAEIASCGREMGIRDFPDTTSEQVVTTLREWQKQPLRLLVLDNLENQKILNEWLPKLNGLHILVTTRRQQWNLDLGLHILPLDTLPRSDSLTLFRQLSPRLINTPDATLDHLPERLGDLPLAIDLAGRYLQVHPTLSPISYLHNLDTVLEHESMQSKWFAALDITSPTVHDLSLLGTFKLSWKKVQNKIQQKIFILSGWLAPNTPIPLDLFKAALEVDTKTVEEALYILYELGLLRTTFGQPVIHPLLAAYARTFDSDMQNLITLRDGLESGIIANLSELTSQEQSLGLLTKLTQLNTHFKVCISYIEKEKPEQIHILSFIHGWLLSYVGNYQEALKTLERDLQFAINKYGTIEHPEVKPTVVLLAGVLTKLARYSDAEHLLATNSSSATDNDTIVEELSTLTLSSLYHDTEDYAKAKALLEPLLSSNEAV